LSHHHRRTAAHPDDPIEFAADLLAAAGYAAAIAKPTPLRGKCAQPRPERLVIRSPGHIAVSLRLDPDEP
jgi:hypothetical protein